MDNRRTLIVWALAAAAGTAAVWWLRSYLQQLTLLAQTDRAAALELFRTRGLPALLVVVAVAVAAGATLMRQGLRMVNAARETGRHPNERPALMAGWMMASIGFVLAAVPLALASVVLWLVRRT